MKVKKVGIITIVGKYSFNYGNRLQNFAVQWIVNEMGMIAETIQDCRNDKDFSSISTYWKILIKKVLHYRTRSRQLKILNFWIWSRKYQRFSPIIFRNNYDLEKLNKRYDYFLVGSDQPWNPFYKFDGFYYADFAPIHKKIALSPSFGTSIIPPEQHRNYQHLLNRFAFLSVREKAGAGIIKNLIDKEVPVLLDPTMIVPMSEWDKMAKKPREEKYIFVYVLGKLTAEYVTVIDTISQAKKMNVINFSDENYSSLDPSDFIGYIKYSNYVITDSFHGSVFSLLYKKPITSLFSKLDNQNELDSSRLDTLFEMFSINYNSKIDINHIEYSNNFDSILKGEQTKFWRYLKNAVDE